MNESLASVFLRTWQGPAPSDDQPLDAVLRQLYDAGRAEWPALAVEPAALVEHIARHAPVDEELLPALAALHAADLYLACACAAHAPGAIEAFDARYAAAVAGFVGRMDASPAFVDDVRQILRERLFVHVPPKIADYSGRGALGSWLRVAAVRTGVSLRRVKSAQPHEDEGAAVRAIAAGGADPELDYIKARYRGEFEAAFQDALAKLDSEQRNVLRLHFVDQLNIDQIGAIFRVHRSTVARWLQASRGQILDETRRILRERMRITSMEFDSLAGLVQSQLDVSIAGALKQSKG
jgi:RNA polymerase sigma-70 factor (ECF subfamily)